MSSTPKAPASLDRYGPAVRGFMEEVLRGFTLPLYTMERYHLGWVDAKGNPETRLGGKGLRSTLCLLMVDMLGGRTKQALPAAAALELVHNFSLVHDDIEDRSPQRRYRDTVWKLWGEAQAINVGDSLFTVARLAMLRLIDNDVPASKVVQLARMLDESCLRLCEGQYIDLDFQTRADVSEGEYLTMIGGKTAALLSASCEIGAVLGSADQRTQGCLKEAGRNLGLAFQIRDDILGLWGEESSMGKLVGEDLRERKRTIPVICGLQRARGRDLDAIETIYEGTTPTQQEISRALAVLEGVGARTYAQQMADQYRKAALAQLRDTGLGNAKVEEFEQLIHFSVERNF